MPEPDYSTTHLRAVDNDECARKKFTSRKLKAKMVMQAVVVSIFLFVIRNVGKKFTNLTTFY